MARLVIAAKTILQQSQQAVKEEKDVTNDIAFIEKMFYEYKKLEDRYLESEV